MSSAIRNTIHLSVVAVGLGLAVGCRHSYTGDTVAGDVCSSATVYFTNESLDQAAVYLVYSGQQARIGTVFPGRTDTLTIPLAEVSTRTVALVARPLAGSRVASSGPLSISNCEQLSVRLPSVANTLIVLPAPR